MKKKEVFRKSRQLGNNVNVSQLAAGLYLIEKSNNGICVEKCRFIKAE